MTYRIVITARARADALVAFRWLNERSPDAAARWYDGFQKAIGKLSKNPSLHPIAEDESALLGLTIREVLYGRRSGVHRILFSVEGETVTIIYVRHSAQGPIEE